MLTLTETITYTVFLNPAFLAGYFLYLSMKGKPAPDHEDQL